MSRKDPETNRQYHAEYRANNRERIKSHSRAWYHRNKERSYEYTVQYRKDHREAVAANRRRYDREKRAKNRPDPFPCNSCGKTLPENRIRKPGFCSKCQPAAAYARGKRYRANHPEKARKLSLDHSHRRRARLLNATTEPINMHLIYQRDAGICHICKKQVKEQERSIDHIVPLSLGGSHTMSNIRLAHISCNSRRNNRGPGQLYLF